MSILRCNVQSVVPNPADNIEHTFVRSVSKEVAQVVYDDKGKEVAKRIARMPFVEPIPLSELANDGVTCDMFSIENLQKAGVSLQPVTAKFFGMSLDARSAAIETLNETDFDVLVSEDVNPQKNLNNE